MGNSALQRLELALMVFEPDALFPKYLHSIDDVATYRSLLRATPYSIFAVEYLIDLVWDRVRESRRRNLVHGLNAIKWAIQNRDEQSPLVPESTIDRLFGLYQYFVFDRLAAIRWSVSAILRDKPLRKRQIKWLLSHHQDSTHIINRILRYPKYDPLVAAWAREKLFAGDYSDRTSELLSRLIRHSIPPCAENLPTCSVLWAIYYAPVEPKTKRRLLADHASLDGLDDLIKICVRLGMQDVLLQIRKQITGES